MDPDPQGVPRPPVHRLVVPAGWMDGNGHVNAAFYQLMVKDPAILAHDEWGYGPSYQAESGRSSFVLESHVTHVSEVKAGEAVSVACRIMDLDDKRLHLLFEIVNESTGTLAALVQYLTIHVVMEPKPRAASFPAELRTRLEALKADHRARPLPRQAANLRRLGEIPAGEARPRGGPDAASAG